MIARRSRFGASAAWALLGAGALALASGGLASCGGTDDTHDAPSTSADAGKDSATQPLCVDGKPTGAWPAEPHAVSLTATLPPGLTFEGPDGPVRIDDYFEPCGDASGRSRILVVRTSGTWCGTCRWHAAHTKRILEAPKLRGRVVLVDLLVSDEDNVPATTASAVRFKALLDAPQRLAVDPRFSFVNAQLARGPLPLYAFVDTKTMSIVSAMNNPDPDTLVERLALELASLDGEDAPHPTSPRRFDELFTEDQWDLLHEMTLPGAPPPDPTNELADSATAAAFGKSLFSDVQLSPSGTVACVTCHDPAKDFTDGLAQSKGVLGARLARNAPPIALAAHARWQFWDGRADTLWAQALGPPEDPQEMGSSRLFIAHQIADRYAVAYDAVFGSKYPLPVTEIQSLPPAGKPGDTAYDALPAAAKESVTRVYVNVGKALAAFERTLRVAPNALDRYAAGDLAALTQGQKEGLSTYFEVGCAQCHWGPRLTDDAFHVIRFPTGRADGAADRGRYDVLAGIAKREFVASSEWSDAPGSAKSLLLPESGNMLGAFKTPTLRGLPTSGPYGHGGTFATLAEVAKHYGERGLDHADGRAIGTTEQWVPRFDPSGQAELTRLLEVLSGAASAP